MMSARPGLAGSIAPAPPDCAMASSITCILYECYENVLESLCAVSFPGLRGRAGSLLVQHQHAFEFARFLHQIGERIAIEFCIQRIERAHQNARKPAHRCNTATRGLA